MDDGREALRAHRPRGNAEVARHLVREHGREVDAEMEVIERALDKVRRESRRGPPASVDRVGARHMTEATNHTQPCGGLERHEPRDERRHVHELPREGGRPLERQRFVRRQLRRTKAAADGTWSEIRSLSS